MMIRAVRRRVVAGAGAAMVLLCASACSDGGTRGGGTPTINGTVAIGQLPEPLSDAGGVVATPAPPVTVPTTTEPIEPIEGPIGDVVDGNRLLLIGDTAMVALTARAEGSACEVLPDFGWQTTIEAERGRFITFADDVLDEYITDSTDRFDVYGLMFGHHTDTEPDVFGAALGSLVDQLAPAPVILYTVAPIEIDGSLSPRAVAINDEIRAVAESKPQALLIDWSLELQTEADVRLLDEGFTPSADGVDRLVILTAATLGAAPTLSGAGCSDALFTDDSAIIIGS